MPRLDALRVIVASGVFLTGESVDPDAIRINEVSDKGSSSVCGGNDWIELLLPGSAAGAVNLEGYVLHDNRGPLDDERYLFPPMPLAPGEFLLLCVNADGFDPAVSPQFGIGGDDQLTLLDPSGVVVSTTGQLGDRGEFDVSFAYDVATSGYTYTATPTPGFDNVITALPEPETLEEMRARLSAQNDIGTNFFNMDGNGLPVEDGFDEIVDLRMEMDPEVWDEMVEEQSFEIYSPFLRATVTAMDMPDEILYSIASPGRIRPRGQSTLAFGTCLGKSVPYGIDWDHVDPDQTLFGMERSYLRTHLMDGSFTREWASHRMLARFDLPHLRTRTVRFFVNGAHLGLYELMEAPDQNYVFQRSFPAFDPQNYALFKVKSHSVGCGLFDEATLAAARERLDANDVEPYSFERGDHREKVPVLGAEAPLMTCITNFFDGFTGDYQDVALAYLRHGEKCGETLVEEGLIDRDLGVKALDEPMMTFIDSHLASKTCDNKCSNSNLASDVDVNNWLRNFAVMAATLNQDSPIGNGNNYLLAYSGSEDSPGWSIVQYDHNNVMSYLSGGLCDQSCLETVYWSIVRPTCRSLEQNQLVGPLLSDDALHAQYIEFVRDFVNDVMNDDGFLAQVRGHLEAIQDEVPKDPWNDLADFFSLELDENAKWVETVPVFPFQYDPFIPFLRERSAQILEQLAAIDEDSFPRDLDDIGAGEACVDWRADRAPETACTDACQYEGCVLPGFVAAPFCDETTGKCYHGMPDELCTNVTTYDGIEGFGDSGMPAFCIEDPMIGPIRVAECPAPQSSAESVKTCYKGCNYDGCLRPEFTIPAFCDEESGTCVHGVSDEKCVGIENLGQYEGMESLEGSTEPTVCFTNPMVGALRMAQCPPPPVSEPAKSCYENCLYEGCVRSTFAVPAFCDTDTGICYHGDSDVKCEGVGNTNGYLGILSFEGNDNPAFCWLDENIGPLRMAECPDPEQSGDIVPSDDGETETPASDDGETETPASPGNGTDAVNGAGNDTSIDTKSGCQKIAYNFAFAGFLSLVLFITNELFV